MPALTLRDRDLFYEETGTGFPVVFSHSYLMDRHMWAPQIKALSQKYRCITPDLWGHGKSQTRLEKTISLEDLAQDTWALTQALELEKFAFVGLSVGGMIGAYLAFHHPDKLQSLTVMGSYVGPESESSKAEYMTLINLLEQASYFTPDLIEVITPYLFCPKTFETQPDLIQSFKKSLADISCDKVTCLLSIGRGIFNREDWRSQLSTLKVPTQYIVGDQDAGRPPHESEEMAKLTPDSVCHKIPDAGHISCLEQPDLVTEKIDRFIQKCSEHSSLKSVA